MIMNRALYFRRRLANYVFVGMSLAMALFGLVWLAFILGALLKNGILGVHHAVSAKYLQTYVGEYVFRYNHRKDEAPMFQTLMGQVQKA